MRNRSDISWNSQYLPGTKISQLEMVQKCALAIILLTIEKSDLGNIMIIYMEKCNRLRKSEKQVIVIVRAYKLYIYRWVQKYQNTKYFSYIKTYKMC